MSFDDLARFKETYINECFELLRDMEELLLSLDSENADSEALNAIFRCAHSIKGGAGAFGFDRITKFTHVAEFLLDAMREGKISAQQEIVDALLKSVDVITTMVRAAQSGTALAADFGSDLEQKLQAFADAANGAAPAIKATAKPKPTAESGECNFYSIKFVPHSNMLASGNEPLLLLRELGTLGNCKIIPDVSAITDIESLDPSLCYLKWQIDMDSSKPESAIKDVFEFVDTDCDLDIENFGAIAISGTVETQVAQKAQTKPTEPVTKVVEETVEQKAPTVSTIRVDLEKIDRLVNLVGELVITQSMISAQTRFFQPDQHADLLRGVDELSQHCRELQEAVMSVRMQPVKSIFSRMPRIVRDISQKLGKKISLVTSGEGTEVDKTVIEQLGDPLTHMIRNAVDHGIEMPAIRAANGKSEEGHIHLTAFHQGGKIYIQISDDGAGINREAVLRIARNKGIIAEDAQLSDYDIDNLIFKPGFSTAEKVTDISGRGVGMDVVRRNIESMNGSVHIDSTPGKGSVFTVSLPLTLAILDGMVVRVASEQYIVPIANILETLKPQREHMHKVAGSNDMLNVRGEFISLLYLNDVFKVRKLADEPEQALVILVESNGKKVGLVVDELIGQQQVVIKSLESNSDPVFGISGATILGDGNVSLIMDIAQLQSMANVKNTEEAA